MKLRNKFFFSIYKKNFCLLFVCQLVALVLFLSNKRQDEHNSESNAK